MQYEQPNYGETVEKRKNYYTTEYLLLNVKCKYIVCNTLLRLSIFLFYCTVEIFLISACYLSKQLCVTITANLVVIV